MKIAVCVPHTGAIKAATAHCLVEMLVATCQTKFNYNGSPAVPTIIPLLEEAGPLELKRTKLAREALRLQTDYLLWVDSDQTFPPDALIRLMRHNKPMIGTNCPSRHNGCATAKIRGETVARGTGVQQVGAVGLGFCLLHTSILLRVPHPWFQIEIVDGELDLGEDVHFCNQVQAAGIPVFVDHDLTVGHLAEVVLTLKEGEHAVSVLTPFGPQ